MPPSLKTCDALGMVEVLLTPDAASPKFHSMNVGSGTNYDLLATAQGAWGDWLSLIDSQGNVTLDGDITANLPGA